MTRLTGILVSALAVLGAQAVSSSAVLDLIPDNFDDVVLKSGKPALVEFFAPWCGHCKTLAPVYEELGQNFAHAQDKVSIAKVDADAEKSLGKRFGVQGFPTVKFFDGKSAKPVDYDGGRDLESLSKFITEKTGVKPRVKKALPSKVEMLGDATFKKQIGGDQDVLVAFTAPWCGHCKSLAPIWETVASDFANEPGVVVAKVDCEADDAKDTAKEQGVSSYPTIKFFPKGSTTPQPYEGGRSEEAVVAFLNEKAGTHRTVGGGLDAKAGTIAALDSIVAKFVGGATLAGIAAEAKKAAKDLKDTSAAYYVKVFDKLAQNQDYAQKEFARLQGILKKGGLAPEKVDDLTVRTNVLQQFLGTREKDMKDEL
ncbi:MAG: hypothetical protein M1832_003436 [Thelocarpon impressellum]|nr:MAG: hypothetical protein M1832_003436 [Thelocarpon impressellum]